MMKSPVRTIESMKRRRKRKRRGTIEAGPVILVTVGIVIVLLIWLLGAVLLKGFLLASELSQEVQEDQEPAKLLSDFPELIVDVFPSQLKSRQFVSMLKTCLPSDDKEQCQTRSDPDNPIPQVVIASTPGVFGLVFEEFIAALLELRVVEEDQLALTASAHIAPGAHAYTKVIRTVVVPPLLEAIDLALLATDETYPVDQITWEDVLGVVRLLGRWHCRLNRVAEDTALWNIMLDEMISLPKETENGLASFVNVPKEGEDIEMDDLAAEVLVRVDKCGALAMTLQKRRADDESLERAAMDALQEEMASPVCQSTVDWDESLFSKTSQVVEIVGHFLDTRDSTMEICKQHPNTKLCESQQVEEEE